jgi:PAS domain S-box-containing protein
VIVGVYGIARDITQSYQAEQDLKHSREQLQKIMDSSLDVICTFDEDKRFVKVSKAALPVWGYLPEELEGTCYTDLIQGKDPADINKSADAVLNGNDLRRFENRYQRKDGKIITMSLLHCPGYHGKQGGE